MKYIKYFSSVLFITSALLSSCSKEVEPDIINDLEQDIKSVSMLCPDFTDKPVLAFGLYISKGGPEDLAKHNNPKPFLLPKKPNSSLRYEKSDVVGMGTDGDSNLNFVWYKDGNYSAGTSNNLDSERKPKDYSYTLPINPQTQSPYTPEDIVGMAVDGENNTVYTWYKNKYVSAGSPANLGSKRSPRLFLLAKNPRTGNEFKTSEIRAIAIDGGYNLTVVFYQNRFFSIGTTTSLGYHSEKNGGQAECIEKLPAAGIKTRHFLGAGIDYTNRHVLLWFKSPIE